MLLSMTSGLAGLKAQQTELDVIGNNIANVNTTGFKSSRADLEQNFSQILTQASGGGPLAEVNPQQVGLGVTVGGISMNTKEGTISSTGRSLDTAIQGSGYFVCSNGNSDSYTRDGAFEVNSSGELVSEANPDYQVNGWLASNDGTINTTTPVTGIKVSSLQSTIARATQNVAFTGNLDSETASTDTVTTSTDIYDSNGTSHPLTLAFQKSATDGQWTWTATSTDGTISLPTGGTGTVTFDTNGKVSAGGNASMQLALTSANGAKSPQAFTLDLSSLSALNSGGQSTVTTSSQDGIKYGELTGYSIDSNGVLSGAYSNGLEVPVAQIALAKFNNTNGLSSSNGNFYGSTVSSGEPLIGTAANSLVSESLESSNVDLAGELSNMIISQRAFQAASKVVTTSDQLLQEILQIKQ